MKHWLLVPLAGLLLVTGCATTGMKGTPFYTGEHEVREGPAADRINLWPIVYYRDPALSVLWPIMEFSPDRLAVRPVYSVHDRNSETPVYNVLWPLGRFDTANHDYRFFPVYWGDDYSIVFPLYWNKDNPVSGTGYNTLFPLWIKSNKPDGTTLHVAWPFYTHYDHAGLQGWRLWPLYGSKEYIEGYYRYWAWPLGHAYADAGGSGHMFVPFYYYNRTDARSQFASLLYGRNSTTQPEAHSWDYLVPLWYRSWEGDTFNWTAIPALSWGTKNAGMHDNRYVLGLAGNSATADSRAHHVFPFYGYGKNSERTWITSLPYSRSLAARPMDKSWDLALPLWYRGWEGDTFSWSAIPALSWGVKNDGMHDNKYVAGLVRSAETEDTRSHHVIPFYGYGKNPERTWLTTLPYSRSLASRPQEKSWDLVLPLWYRSWESETFNWTAIPALSWGVKGDGMYDNKYAAGLVRSAATDDSRMHYVLPFYYHNRSDSVATFYSLPWWSARDGDGLGWSASFPFYYSRSSEDGSIMLTPFYAHKRQPDGETAWKCFIPLVYVDQTKEAHFMTLLGGRWRMGDESRWLALPLLSGGKAYADAGRNVWLAGLAGNRWDAEGSSHYAIPFYYSAPEKGTFASLPYVAWQKEGWQHRTIPLLLSGNSVSNETSKTTLLAGLGGWKKEGDELQRSHVFPFYYSSPETGTFASLAYARWASADGRTNSVIPLLLSGKSDDGVTAKTEAALGLAAWEKERGELKKSRVFPFYWWEKDDYFYTALYGRNADMNYYLTPLVGSYAGEDSGSWVFPFYRHLRESDGDVHDSYLLLGKYENEKNRRLRRFWPLFKYEWQRSQAWEKTEDPDVSYQKTDRVSRESKNLSYLFLGKSSEWWNYDTTGESTEDLLDRYGKESGFWPVFNRSLKRYYDTDDGESKLKRGSRKGNTLVLGWSREDWRCEAGERVQQRKRGGLFPLWKHNFMEDMQAGNLEKTSSYLGFLYDTRHEKQAGEKEHDYQRRRVLWRLYHHEKLNGDKSTDIFPGVTIDSYKNGYYKCSVLWRLFRYEKDPEDGSKKLDFLFIPFRR